MMRRLIPCGLAALLLTACQREAEQQLAELSGRIFVFNYRVATANYLVTLRRTGTLPEGGSVEAEFENPRGGNPLTIREKLFPMMEKISLASPPIECVRQDRPYAVKIRLLDSDGTPLQTIETTVTSNVDQSILPAKPLVVGPGYDPNPDVFKPDGSADYSPVADCPA